MLLSDLASPQERRHAYTYSLSTMDKVVNKYATIQLVQGYLYMGKFEESDLYTQLFFCPPEAKICLHLYGVNLRNPQEQDANTLYTSLRSDPLWNIESAQAFLQNMDQTMSKGGYIRMLEVAFAAQLDAERASRYIQYRQKREQAKEQERRQAREENARQQEQQRQQVNMAADEKVAAAVQQLFTQPQATIHNETIQFYKGEELRETTLFVYMANHFGIPLHPSTKGWLRKRCNRVDYKNGEAVTIWSQKGYPITDKAMLFLTTTLPQKMQEAYHARTKKQA